MIHDHSIIALHYQQEILKWADPEYYDSNVIRVQLPYVAPAATPGLTVEQQKERKRELARRLMEINARKREERVIIKIKYNFANKLIAILWNIELFVYSWQKMKNN